MSLFKKRIKSKLPKSVQQALPFDDIRPDGICIVGDGYYTITIQFADRNYELSDEEEQESIFADTATFSIPLILM